ncbi:cytochrome c oxidase subunit 3 [Tanacetum coccineum]
MRPLAPYRLQAVVDYLGSKYSVESLDEIIRDVKEKGVGSSFYNESKIDRDLPTERALKASVGDKRFFLDQNSGMEGTTRKIYSFSNRPAKTDVQKDPSPWPISGSLGALATTVGGVMYMHSFQGGATLLSLGLIFILYTMFVWWRDVLRESTLEGHHTKVVQLGPRYGFILFIVSEVMFLFALFRASSHSSLAPTVEIGGIWPPKGIAVLDPREIPFLNTLIPLSSGAAVTWAHHAILAGKEKRAVYALVATVSLALVFTAFQGMEYYQAPSTISDSIYGSTFFLATGFHGFHVIIGTLFSIICGIRQYLGHLTKEHHVGFEAAAWDRRDYGRSCSPRNDPKLDLGLFEIVPFNRNQRCFLVSRFFSEQIEEPNGSNSSLAATKEIGLALRKERSALSQFLYDVDEDQLPLPRYGLDAPPARAGLSDGYDRTIELGYNLREEGRRFQSEALTEGCACPWPHLPIF